MKILNTSFLVPLFLLSSLLQLSATHLAGGWISYQRLGGDTFLFDLTLYRVCSETEPFDDPAYLGVYDTAGSLVQLIVIANSGEIILSQNQNTCSPFPNSDCISMSSYSKAVILPPIAGGYIVTYQRCCLDTLTNLPDTMDQGITLYTIITETAHTLHNNSPHFNLYPNEVICVNQPHTFDLSASDADLNDTLAYFLSAPLAGASALNPQPAPPLPPPYSAIEFNPGFVSNLPLGTSSLYQLAPYSGQLLVQPDTSGTFLATASVADFRNGQILGAYQFVFRITVGDFSVATEEPVVNVLDIYPNPVSELLRFHISSSSTDHYIAIASSDGRMSKVLNANDVSVNGEINVNDLPAGFYFITIRSKDEIWQGKFVKK